jgi:hypothetical protein
MSGSIVRKAILVSAVICASLFTTAQQPGTITPGLSESSNEIEKTSRPYRILTNGKTITIRSTKNIKSLMVWTSAGNRIIEEKNLNASNYNFRVTVNEKLFFVMVQLADGKTFSEKIGIQ